MNHLLDQLVKRWFNGPNDATISVRFSNWQCVVTSLGKALFEYIISHWGQAINPLWWPSLIKDLQTEPKKGASSWDGLINAECLVYAHCACMDESLVHLILW